MATTQVVLAYKPHSVLKFCSIICGRLAISSCFWHLYAMYLRGFRCRVLLRGGIKVRCDLQDRYMADHRHKQ